MTTEAFWNALKQGDREAVLTLLDAQPALLDERWPTGHTPLRFAFECGHRELAEALAERRPPDALGACLLGRLDRLAELGASLDLAAERSPDGWTLLHMAAFAGRADAAAFLLEAGADVAAVSENEIANTPLHAALAGAGDAATVTLLLARGADPEATGEQGIRPLHLAASRGADELVAKLVAAGAASRAMDDGRLPADLARERGFPELAAQLDARTGPAAPPAA